MASKYTIDFGLVRVTIQDGPNALNLAEAIAQAIASEEPGKPVEIQSPNRGRIARFFGEKVETVKVRRR